MGALLSPGICNLVLISQKCYLLRLPALQPQAPVRRCGAASFTGMGIPPHRSQRLAGGRTRVRDALIPVRRGFVKEDREPNCCIRVLKIWDSRKGKMTRYQLAGKGSSPPHRSYSIQRNRYLPMAGCPTIIFSSSASPQTKC